MDSSAGVTNLSKSCCSIVFIIISMYIYIVYFTGCFVDEGDFFHLQSGQFSEDMIPTVGFNMRKVTKGNVTIKVSLKAFIKVL